jgi:hypothetical protein
VTNVTSLLFNDCCNKKYQLLIYVNGRPVIQQNWTIAWYVQQTSQQQHCHRVMVLVYLCKYYKEKNITVYWNCIYVVELLSLEQTLQWTFLAAIVHQMASPIQSSVTKYISFSLKIWPKSQAAWTNKKTCSMQFDGSMGSNYARGHSQRLLG